MTGIRRRWAVALGSALAVMVLSGCGGGSSSADPTPTFSPSTSPTVVSTITSPIGAPPTETAADFVERWNQANTDMQNTGDTAPYRSVSVGCGTCRTTADLVDGYYGAGGSVKTRGWTLKSLQCKETGKTAKCVASIENSPTQVRKSAGSPQEELNGGKFEAIFNLNQNSNGTWNLSDLEQQAS